MESMIVVVYLAILCVLGVLIRWEYGRIEADAGKSGAENIYRSRCVL